MKIKYPFSIFFLFLLNFTIAQTPLDTAVDFTVTDTDGHSHHLFEYLDAGKHVLIDFFFTTCGSCITAMPDLNDGAQRYGCNNGDIIFLSIDVGDTDAQVIAYEESYGGIFPAASGNDGGGNSVVNNYSITAFPTVILIAPDRKILNKDIYPVTASNLDAAINGSAGIVENPEACATKVNESLFSDEDYKMSIYPNPATDFTTLEINLNKSGKVSVEIFNIFGKKVLQPYQGTIMRGTYAINIPAFELSRGLYFIKTTVNGNIKTIKFEKI